MGERLNFEGVDGGPFEPVSAAQMEKKKVLDRVLTVRNAEKRVYMYEALRAAGGSAPTADCRLPTAACRYNARSQGRKERNTYIDDPKV